MPFDTTLGDPRITILPPTPERGGGPRRIVVEIEIIDRRQQSPRGYRFGTFTQWLIMIGMLAMLFGCTAHAQNWQSWQQGFTTQSDFYYGPNRVGTDCQTSRDVRPTAGGSRAVLYDRDLRWLGSDAVTAGHRGRL